MNERDPLDALAELVEPFDNDPAAGMTCYAAPTPSAKQAVRREMDTVIGMALSSAVGSPLANGSIRAATFAWSSARWVTFRLRPFVAIDAVT